MRIRIKRHLLYIKRHLVFWLLSMRFRVEGTRLLYFWIVLPSFLRIAPFALALSAVSNGEKSLAILMIFLTVTISTTFLRRIPKMERLWTRSLPSFIKNEISAKSRINSTVLLTLIENIPTVIMLGILISLFTASDFQTGFKFVLITLFILLIGLFHMSKLINVWSIALAKFPDLKFSQSYIFVVVNIGVLALFINIEAIGHQWLALIPFGYFALFPASIYSELFFIHGVISLLLNTGLLFLLSKKYPYLGDHDCDEEEYGLYEK